MSFTSQDWLALQDLALSYARGVDRRDRVLFLSAFHPDATLTVPAGQVLTGHDQIGHVAGAITGYDRTFHFLGQSAYEPPDEALGRRGTARGEVYCIAYHWAQGKPTWITQIRYQDTYRQNDTDWLIIARRVVVDRVEEHGRYPRGQARHRRQRRPEEHGPGSL